VRKDVGVGIVGVRVVEGRRKAGAVGKTSGGASSGR